MSTEENKPKYYWLDIATPYGDPCDFIHTEDPEESAKRNGTHYAVSATNIKVVETSYAEELERKLQDANEKIERLEWQVTALLSQIQGLKSET